MSSPRPSIPTADIISSLPDSVLSHILSFLPTKLTVATSILSKRWTKLWLSVPTLDVDKESFKDFASFRLFVYSVIASRHPNLPIESFHIRCRKCKSSMFNPCDLNRFVLAAVQRGLQNFYLEFDRYLVPSVAKILAPNILRVLNCETLVVLKLKNLWVFDVPHLVHLPLLKTLHLKDIIFEECEHLVNLLNGCPILEDLHINILQLYHNCKVSMKEFKGFPNLVRANIRSCELVFSFACLYNAKFMCVGVEEMSIYKYRVSTFHNLTYMELIFSCEWSEMWVIQVLQHCPKLQNLILIQAPNDLEFEVEEVIEVEDWKDPETVPECLSSQLRTCSLKGFKGNQCLLHFAEYIMLNSKILRTMTIQSNLVDEKAKYQILKKLSSYSRGSVTCKLFFD